ncbi:hypothetical protein VZT92_027758 [Zoarces viviparus]|uniref:Ig-like domain-containing protein n=1 Tax=Zoarces viviparus TaxID=48416 RepID=A0AAW1DW58_ZOAVI
MIYDSRLGKWQKAKDKWRLSADTTRDYSEGAHWIDWCLRSSRSVQPSRLATGRGPCLECSVVGFFPQEVRVSWLRDGAEVDADVSSTDTLADGDWSFQLHSYLELTPRRGERVSCRVDHSSLRTSLEVDWDTSSLDAKYLKMTVGIICFFLGFTAAAGGAAYYWWKQRFAFRPLGSQGHTSPRHPSELLIF